MLEGSCSLRWCYSIYSINPNRHYEQIYDITNNFPLQKWTCILVSVDNKIIDVYLDGKLVKSIENKTTINSDASQGIGLKENYGMVI